MSLKPQSPPGGIPGSTTVDMLDECRTAPTTSVRMVPCCCSSGWLPGAASCGFSLAKRCRKGSS